MIAFHGIDDSIVPFANGFPVACSTAVYGKEYGSYSMNKRLMNKYPGVPVELYACYGGHGIFNRNPKTDSKSLYRIQKAICFFERVRNGDKTRAYIRIDEQEDSITRKQLDSMSPVSCSFQAESVNEAISNSKTERSTRLIIHPNPAASNVALLIEGRLKEINITLTDLSGKTLWSRQSINEKAINLPIQVLADGLYFVIVKSNEYSCVLKLVKRN